MAMSMLLQMKWLGLRLTYNNVFHVHLGATGSGFAGRQEQASQDTQGISRVSVCLCVYIVNHPLFRGQMSHAHNETDQILSPRPAFLSILNGERCYGGKS